MLQLLLPRFQLSYALPHPTLSRPAVSGLWYILLITVGLSMLLTLQHNVRKDPAKMASVRRFSSFVGSSISRRVRPSSTGGPSGWPPHGPGGGTADTAVEAFTSGAPGVQGGRAAAEAAVAAAVQDSRGASGARAPSTLRVFLGTASVNRRVSDRWVQHRMPLVLASAQARQGSTRSFCKLCCQYASVADKVCIHGPHVHTSST